MYYVTSFIQLLSLLHIIAGMHHTVTCPTYVPFTTVGPTCILHIHTPLVSLLPCTACMRHIAHTMSPTPLMSPLLPYTLQISCNNSYPIPCVFLHHGTVCMQHVIILTPCVFLHRGTVCMQHATCNNTHSMCVPSSWNSMHATCNNTHSIYVPSAQGSLHAVRGAPVP